MLFLLCRIVAAVIVSLSGIVIIFWIDGDFISERLMPDKHRYNTYHLYSFPWQFSTCNGLQNCLKWFKCLFRWPICTTICKILETVV